MALDLRPETEEMLARAEAASSFLKTLAHPARLMIVCALVEGERSVRALEDGLGLRQPALSQQLAALREAGLIAARKESKSVYYRLADGRAAEFVAVMHRLFCADGGSET